MKRFTLPLCFALILWAYAGCTSNSADGSAVPAPIEKDAVEISVITSYGGDDGNRQNYERAIRAYEAASGNIVADNSSVSNEEWKAMIMSAFEAGTEPDVLFYFTGADSNKLVEAGQVVPIDEIRSAYPDYAGNMKDEMLAKSPVDGKSYAVPVNGYWEALYVNKKVLADCGVDIPDADTTWGQFLEDCRIIAEKGYVPIAASLYEVPHYWFEFCVFNNGSLETHANLPASSSDEIGQVWAAGLNDIKELFDSDLFPDNTTTAANAVTDVLMIDNKAAFMIDGSWKIGWFSENAADINNFTVTFVPGKGERRSTDLIGGISMGYFITQKAWNNPEKQAACVEFVQAMTTDEVVATFGATAITALEKDMVPPSGANALVMDALAMTRSYTGIVAATADGLLPNARSNLFGNVTNIVTGSITVDEAIDSCLANQK